MDTEAPHSISETGALPPERFADAGEVMEVARDLIQKDGGRAQDRAKVQGVVDGNRPYRQGILTQHAQGWRANVNYREGEGIIETNRSPFDDLCLSAHPMAQFEIDYGASDQASKWALIIGEEYHRMLSGWTSFDWHTELRNSEMMIHGYGTHIHTSVLDWRPRTCLVGRALFPDGTTSDLENLSYFVLRDKVGAEQLYGWIKDEDSGAKVGWQPAAAWRAIAHAAKDQASELLEDPREVQGRMKRGDIGFSRAHCREIELIHCFVAEFGGGISHYIVANTNRGETAEYVFKRRHRFKTFAEIITLFPYNIGSDGTIHSIRGLGTKIFPFMELSNRLNNHMVDQVLALSGLLLSAEGVSDVSKLQLLRNGPMSILPEGVKPETFKMARLDEGPLMLQQQLQNTMNENTRSGRQSVSTWDKQSEPTATHALISNTARSQLQQSAHNRYYRRLDAFYDTIGRRACNPNISDATPAGKMAYMFQQRCLKRGVPAAAFVNISSIKAMRNMGAGSAAQRIQAMESIMQMVYPVTDEQGKDNIIRDFIAAMTGGYNKVPEYYSRAEVNQLPTEDEALAVIENGLLMRSEEVLVTSTQAHALHLERHFERGFRIYEELQETGDFETAMPAIENFGQHMSQHLELLGQDPTRKPEFQQFNQMFQQFAKLADQVRQQADEMMGAGGGEEEQSPPDDRIVKMQMDQEAQAMKMDMAQQKHEQSMAHAEERHQVQTRAQLNANLRGGQQ